MDKLPTHWPLTVEAVTVFISFVLSDEAQRPSVRSRRQKLSLQGRYVSYGVKVYLRRGSDRAERIYVSVTALQKGGLTNYQACCEVAGRLESKLGGSRRGRPRTKPRSPEFADKVETVRSIYNRFKLRHPWKEKLSERDLVYEQWCWRFRFFQQWVADLILSAVKRGLSGEKFAEELAHGRGQGGRNNYRALAGLGQDGLVACLNSWPSQRTAPPLLATQVKRFVREFFNRMAT
jgi:hypothetical protein